MSENTIDNKINAKKLLLYLFCGVFIGLGAVLPGVSGGVLCVIFGIYKPIMDFLSSPFKTLKRQADIIIPAAIGIGIGFLGVSKILGVLLDSYPDQSVCVFVGLIFGMLPSLFKDAGKEGNSKGSYIGLVVGFIIIAALLITLKIISFDVTPNIWWYLFCGFCITLSVIVPGMSFSTLLMPLGLYNPLINGIGNLNFSILIPVGIGALITVILLAKAASVLMEKYYSIAFHTIIGIVIAATVMIIPFESIVKFDTKGIIEIVCIILGAAASLLFDKIGQILNKNQ